MWYNEDVDLYSIVEIHKKIPDIDLSHQGRAKYVFNISGNYTFRLYRRYQDMGGKFATPSFQNINVISPIPPIITPTSSASVSPTSTIIENPKPTQTTSTTITTPKSTPIPTPGTLGFEAVLAIISVLTISYLIRREN